MMSEPKQDGIEETAPSTTQAALPQAPIDNLRPWEINFKDIKDEKTKQHVEIIMKKWMNNLQKDLDDLLSKNGITVFELGFIHTATKGTMLITNGELLAVTKAAKLAYIELRGRVAEQVSLPEEA